MTDQSLELETYRQLLPSLKSEEGKYALISGDKLLGVYEAYADALAIGYEKCNLNKFIVKRIETTEYVFHFTRPVAA